MPPPDDRLLSAVRRVLRDRRGVEVALLFGSRSRGPARRDSDADLAIHGQGIDRLALARDLSLATDVEFDLVDLDRAGYALLQSVLREGVVVHEREPGAAARWRKAAETRLREERPGFERMRDAVLAGLAARPAGDG